MNISDIVELSHRGVKKGRCPSCGHNGVFTYFVLKENGNKVGDDFGRCDREQNCGNIKWPTFADLKNMGVKTHGNPSPKQLSDIKPPSEKIFISDVFPSWVDVSCDLLKSFPMKRCPFLAWLFNLTCDDETRIRLWETITDYRVGVAPNMEDVLFWYIDERGRVCDCKSIAYKADGHRDKEKEHGEAHYYGVLCFEVDKDHNVIPSKMRKYWGFRGFYGMSLPDEVVTQDNKPSIPFFGSHLVYRYPDATIVIVESEKTAILGSLIFDPHDMLFVATRGKANFNVRHIGHIRIFRDRDCIVYADKDCEDEWRDMAESIMIASKAKSMDVASMADVCKYYDVDINQRPDNYDVGDLFVELLEQSKNE